MTDPVTRLNAALEGRYRIELQLGEGGMATVYLADDLRHERKVALKVLKPELAAVVGADRFLAEIKTTANLQHPHILPLFDSGEADSFLFYVMPYVEGESLRERLDREHQLPVDEAVQIAKNVAEALDYAHRQGVIHRDIKPANILLQDGKPVVSDFGIALAVGAAVGGRLTETGLSLGTPHYMSPEQATGDLTVGAATDIYAVGCVLYEMLVGEPPFTGSTPQAVLGKIVTGNAPSASAERKSVPPNVDAAIRRALEKVPADRFVTAGSMAQGLGDVTFRWGEYSAAVSSREVHRWRRRTIGAGTIALAFALAFVWQLAESGSSDRSLRYSSVLLPEGYLIASNSSQPLTIAADGSRIAFRLLGEQGDGEIWSRRFSDPEPSPVPGGDASSGSIFLSADGEWVAFNNPAGREIRRAPVNGGPSQRVGPNGLQQTGGGFRGGSWGPDDEIVIATANGIRLFPADGGPPVDLTSTDVPAHSQPSFLPDGEGIVFTAVTESAAGAGTVVSVLRFGQAPVEVTPGHSPRVTRDGILVYSVEATESVTLSAVRLSSDFTRTVGTPATVAENVFTTTILSGTSSARYALADDGTLALLTENVTTTPGLAWVDRDGRIEPVLDVRSSQFPEPPSATRGITAARISPDGGRIAFRTYYGREPLYRIFVLDAERGVLNPLSVAMNADWPVWTPDGERLLFNRFDQAGTGEHNVYWARADNADRASPFWEENPLMQHPQDFSPDGRYLVFQQTDPEEESPSDLWLHDRDTGEVRPLLATTAVERQADISPDGRWLAFVSDEGGRLEVYVTEFPDPRTRTKISTAEAVSPAWSPSGDELFYLSVEERAIMAARVELESTFRASPPEMVVAGNFSLGIRLGRAFDVHPNGDRFLVGELTGEIGAAPRIQVVQNWLDEVRRRLDQ